MKSAFAAAVLAILLSSCASNDLTSEQAKGLLNDYFAKNPVTQKLLTGMDNIGTASEAEYFATTMGKYQKALEADGLITITSKGKIFNPANHKEFFNSLDIQLTDKGKALVTGTPATVPPPTPNTWPIVYENAVFCSKEVGSVSSVSTTEDTANADYSWHAARPTAFATDFHNTDPSDTSTCNSAVVVNATATFVRKNGAWTMTVAQ